MELEAVKKSLLQTSTCTIDGSTLPPQFYDAFILKGLQIDVIEPGRVVCSLTVPPQFTNDGNYLHGGVISTLVDQLGSVVFYTKGYRKSGVSLDINVSFVGAAFVGNDGNYLHGGVISTLVDFVGCAVFYTKGLRKNGVSLDINVSFVGAAFVGEEIEIEAKLLHAGKAVGVATVELRKKATRKIIAQARHTMYLVVPSKL